MAKSKTTLTMSIKVKLPVSINAADMMNYIRERLSMKETSQFAPIVQDKMREAIKSEDTVVKLVQKFTEYK